MKNKLQALRNEINTHRLEYSVIATSVVVGVVALVSIKKSLDDDGAYLDTTKSALRDIAENGGGLAFPTDLGNFVLFHENAFK